MITNIKKNIFPIVFFGILIFLLYLGKKHDETIFRIKITGKISKSEINGNLDRYYEYKYFYKKKLYKDVSADVDELNSQLIGRCFEVKINPENPSDSKIDLEKELDCSFYYENR